MLSRDQVSAVIVTRGDHSLDPIIKTLNGFGEIIIWDNSKKPRDRRVFGRYLGVQLASRSTIYVQDDDCVVDGIDKLLELSSLIDGALYANMPADYRPGYVGTGITLIGFGAVFPRYFLRVFTDYLGWFPDDDLFDRECDRIFTYMHQDFTFWVDVPFHHLPHATAPDRMYRESRHGDDLKAIKARLAQLPTPPGPQSMPVTTAAVEL